MVSAIRVEDLTKKFKNLTAVDHISFDVESGELFGLLGPNGAGKTTTINMLATLLKPTSGYAEVAGFNVVKERDAVRNSIGIVFQDTALDERLTGRENLDFHSVMYGMQRGERQRRIDEVLELVELTDKASVLVEKYSGGMKRRLEIARGLIHKPKVLFLDEPSLGLDTQTRRHIWEYIKKLNEEDVTIILTTHYMEEADYLCDRVAIVDHGRIVALDTPGNLKDALGGDVLSLEVTESDSSALEEELRAMDWVRGVDRRDGFLELKVSNADKHLPEVFTAAEKRRVTINSVQLRKPSLEDVYLKYTGKTIREHEDSQSGGNLASEGRIRYERDQPKRHLYSMAPGDEDLREGQVSSGGHSSNPAIPPRVPRNGVRGRCLSRNSHNYKLPAVPDTGDYRYDDDLHLDVHRPISSLGQALRLPQGDIGDSSQQSHHRFG